MRRLVLTGALLVALGTGAGCGSTPAGDLEDAQERVRSTEVASFLACQELNDTLLVSAKLSGVEPLAPVDCGPAPTP